MAMEEVDDQSFWVSGAHSPLGCVDRRIFLPEIWPFWACPLRHCCRWVRHVAIERAI